MDWYARRIERMMEAKLHRNEPLVALLMQDLNVGPGDLTPEEWLKDQVDAKYELHGK